MKKTVCILIALLLLSGFALAETEIAVSGSGEVLMSADTCVITLGVEATDREVLNAQNTVNTRIAAIIEALGRYGIEKENINTAFISVYPRYDYTEQGEVLSASATSTLAIRLNDLTKAGEVIDIAFSCGANTLQNVQFLASDTGDEKAAALREAVNDARAKAEILADAAGLTITGIKSIQETGAYSHTAGISNFSKAAAADAIEEAAGAPTLVQAEKISVYAGVTVIFSAE